MKNMWLVQKGKFKNENEIDNTQEVIGFSHIADLAYMGAAEFEAIWSNSQQKIVNPLAVSLKRFVKNRENYQYNKVTKLKDALDNQMYVYCNNEDTQEAISAVRKLAKGEPCKRYHGVDSYLRASKEDLIKDMNESKYLRMKMDFWWDIENDILIFFGEDKMEKINGVLDILHEKWKDELFPPVKNNIITKIKMLFSRKKYVKM